MMSYYLSEHVEFSGMLQAATQWTRKNAPRISRFAKELLEIEATGDRDRARNGLPSTRHAPELQTTLKSASMCVDYRPGVVRPEP